MNSRSTPIKARRLTPARRARRACCSPVRGRGHRRCAQPTPAHAQRIPIIRDAEIEQLLRDYLKPVLRAAGLGKQNVHVVLINDMGFNAFVMDGRHIFVNAGALFDSKTPNEIDRRARARDRPSCGRPPVAPARAARGGADPVELPCSCRRRRRHRRSAKAEAAASAWPASRRRRRLIRRRLLAYVRSQEDQADHAALKFLDATGQSPKGMVETFKRMSRRYSLQGAPAPIPISKPIRCRPIASPRSKRSPRPARTGTRRIRGAAASPRPRARQARGLPRSRRHDRAPLSGERHQPAGPLCARDRGLSQRAICAARSRRSMR